MSTTFKIIFVPLTIHLFKYNVTLVNYNHPLFFRTNYEKDIRKAIYLTIKCCEEGGILMEIDDTKQIVLQAEATLKRIRKEKK